MPTQKKIRTYDENDPHISHLGDSLGDIPDDSFEKLVRFLKKRTWVMLSIVGVGFGVASLVTLLTPKMYTATAEIEIVTDQSSQFRIETTQALTGMTDDAERLDTQIQILRSRTLALETIQSLHLESNPKFLAFRRGRPWDISQPAVRNALVSAFEQDLDIARTGHTSLITIKATTLQPDLSKMIVNTLIDDYIEHSFRDNYSSTVKISSWLESQLGDLKQKLQKSQGRMIDYQRELGVVGLGGGTRDASGGQSILITQLDEMNKQLVGAEVERIVKQARIEALRSSPAGVIDALVGSADTAISANKQLLAQLSAQYTLMSQSYGSGYPPLKSLKAQIDQVQENLGREETNAVGSAQKEYDAALSNENMIRQRLTSAEDDAFTKEEKGAEYEFIREDYEESRLLYDELQERLSEAGILAGLHAGSVHLVDDADTPAGPSRPRGRINLAIGGAAGFILGFGLALILESLDTNLKTMTDIEKALQLPLLAAIPTVEVEDLSPARFKDAILSKTEASWSTMAEALRGLRTSILLSSPGASPKVIMIASSRPSEGKSSVSSLLAITFAFSGARVLLIDADLRRPALAKLFGIFPKHGLSSVLVGGTNIKEAINEWVDLPNLHILTSGPVPPLASELLGSKQMDELLQKLRDEYDFILIDTPPALVVTDAILIGRYADASVLVIRYGAAQRHVVQRCINIFGRAGVHLLGAVVNAVDTKSPEYSEYYGKKYYPYYEIRNSS